MTCLNLHILVLVSTKLFVSLTALSILDLSPTRFVVVYNFSGGPEIIDTAAPLPVVNVKEDELSLYLYTIHNRNNPEILPLNVQDLASSKYFDKSKLNIFLIHGWESYYESQSNIIVKDAYLKVTDANILVFDWSYYAKKIYAAAYVSGTEVGKLLGTFILNMQDYFHINSSSFHLIGHSMGGQLAGVAGKAANGNIDLLVGLDPAGPLYYPLITYNRIESKSAKYVQIIHTNAGQYGYLGDLGDSDFWPNGGTLQPGCLSDLLGFCSHHRSYEFYAASLLLSDGGFTSRSCFTYFGFTLNLCSPQDDTHLGGLNVDTKAKGNYYLQTACSYPYSLN